MLINVINSTFGIDEVVFNFGHKSYTAQELKRISSAFRMRNKHLQDGTVLVHSDKQEELILSLVCLSGFAKKIILLPIDVDSTSIVSGGRDFAFSVLEFTAETFQTHTTNHEECDVKSYHSINTLIVLATSGTSGAPKLIEHSFDFLTASLKVKSTKNTFVWGQVYKVNRFAGLQVLLQSLFGGNRLVISSGDYNVENDAKFFSLNHVNCISATPTYWRKLLMVETAKELNLSTVTLGGELANQSILNALKAAFPLAKIRHIYASTEAGFVFSVSDCKEGFPASWINSDSTEFLLSISEENELLIRKNIEFQSHVDLSSDWSDDYFKTGDIVSVIDNRVLFQGRKSGIINIGGMKLVPEKVESAVMAIDGVLACRVYSIQSSMMGSLVGADIVKTRESLTVKEIKQACQGVLLKHEIPVKIKFVEQVELTNTGKVKRS